MQALSLIQHPLFLEFLLKLQVDRVHFSKRDIHVKLFPCFYRSLASVQTVLCANQRSIFCFVDPTAIMLFSCKHISYEMHSGLSFSLHSTTSFFSTTTAIQHPKTHLKIRFTSLNIVQFLANRRRFVMFHA